MCISISAVVELAQGGSATNRATPSSLLQVVTSKFQNLGKPLKRCLFFGHRPKWGRVNIFLVVWFFLSFSFFWTLNGAGAYGLTMYQ